MAIDQKERTSDQQLNAVMDVLSGFQKLGVGEEVFQTAISRLFSKDSSPLETPPPMQQEADPKLPEFKQELNETLTNLPGFSVVAARAYWFNQSIVRSNKENLSIESLRGAQGRGVRIKQPGWTTTLVGIDGQFKLYCQDGNGILVPDEKQALWEASQRLKILKAMSEANTAQEMRWTMGLIPATESDDEYFKGVFSQVTGTLLKAKGVKEAASQAFLDSRDSFEVKYPDGTLIVYCFEGAENGANFHVRRVELNNQQGGRKMEFKSWFTPSGKPTHSGMAYQEKLFDAEESETFQGFEAAQRSLPFSRQLDRLQPIPLG